MGIKCNCRFGFIQKIRGEKLIVDLNEKRNHGVGTNCRLQFVWKNMGMKDNCRFVFVQKYGGWIQL